MSSPETISFTPEEIAMRESVLLLEEHISKIEDLRNQLHQALAENDTVKQTALTAELQREISTAKRLQAKIEGKESPENILSIDRSIDLVKDFLRKPKAEGGLGMSSLDEENPIAESDIHNEGLMEIDLSKVLLDTSWLPKGETSIKGEKRLEALKSKDSAQIRLDLYVFASLWKLFKTDLKEFEQKLTVIAEANSLTIDDLKKKAIFFDGTIIRGSGGGRSALCLYWDGSGWVWNRTWLGNGWRGSNPSLVLAS